MSERVIVDTDDRQMLRHGDASIMRGSEYRKTDLVIVGTNAVYFGVRD